MATPEQMQILITAQTQDAVNDIQRLAKQLDGVSTKSIPQAGNAMGGMGKKAGQAGIQIQQLVGQVQGGVNPMVALSQQAADLGFVLGVPLLGAVAGITASLAGPLISAIMGAQGSFEELADSIRDVSDSYRDLTEAERKFLALQTRQEITNTEKAIQNVRDSLANLTMAYDRVADAQDVFDVGLESFAESTEGAAEEQAYLEASLSQLERQLAASRKELEYLLDPTKQVNDENAKASRIISELEMRYQNYYTAADIASGRQKVLEEQQKKTTESMQLQVAEIDDLEKAYKNVADRGIKKVEDSLVGLVNGTMSAKDAFKSMATSIINDLIRMQIQQSITGPLGDALGSFLGGTSARGRASSAASRMGVPLATTGKAVGGPVSAGSTYLVGERGPELFTAPAGGGTITRNSQMGSSATIVQNINVTTGVQQTVRAEIANLMPQIAEASKAAVLEARQRGGAFSHGLTGI